MTDDALKPCPFCGGEAEKLDLEEGENFGGSCICCKQCGASSPVHFDRKENLEDSWNRRAPVPTFSITDEAVERAALAMVNADQRRLDLPELASVEEFRFESDRDQYLTLARAALSAASPASNTGERGGTASKEGGDVG